MSVKDDAFAPPTPQIESKGPHSRRLKLVTVIATFGGLLFGPTAKFFGVRFFFRSQVLKRLLVILETAQCFIALHAPGDLISHPANGLAVGVRKVFVKLLDDLPDAAWDLKTQILDGDVLFLEWAAESAVNRVDDGVDTFVFRDGMIWLQTVRYTPHRRG